MGNITRISTINENKHLFTEVLLNKTNKVTKISDESIVNGVAFGVAKIAQKVQKDIALIETHIFPDSAYGQHLDDIAEKRGISPRFGSSASSTYLRLVGDVGTVYLAGTSNFIGNGIVFELLENATIGSEGYVYAKVVSQSTGSKTNVQSLVINTVTTTPAGHKYVTNEYEATGGRDEESDVLFRIRIKEGHNVAAIGTLSYITQVFLKFNSNILKVYCYGNNDQNQSILAIATQNAVDLTQNELDDLLDKSKEYLSLHEYNSTSNSSLGIELRNVEYEIVDISFRAELVNLSKVDETRKNIQIAISKYFDFRYWKPDQKVEWDDLLQIVKSDVNMKYVPDSYFTPNSDIVVQIGKLPRVRGFEILDLDGNLILDNSNVLNPLYYPSVVDVSLQQTVL